MRTTRAGAQSRPSVTSAIIAALLAACSGTDSHPSTETPRGVQYDQHVVAGGMAPPAGTLENPFAGDSQSVAQGADLFVSMN